MGKKRNFIPKQNTHDLLVGTLSMGIPSSVSWNKALGENTLSDSPWALLLYLGMFLASLPNLALRFQLLSRPFV